ncbi:MAG: SirB2 family protein [Chromatiaceae bacterium]|nr:SirB2 family protein [Chromatiaceae bacterium]MCW5584575.1 SirB2 family protein [Chromatiales bacterium]HOP15493.1 SirB2 family protein [Gammaproteobacteria bacterium]HPQ23511.1 SirB2 family protein [Gammaproteobacteria bacterium]
MIGHVELKVIHQSAAALSILGFIIRGGLMIAQSAMLRERWMRSWPHLIDTTLLVSGIWMAANLHFSPANSPWLTAKIVALLIYIALGFVALRLGRTYRIRIAAFTAALACFAYIGLVAVKRSPWPF